MLICDLRIRIRTRKYATILSRGGGLGLVSVASALFIDGCLSCGDPDPVAVTQ